MTARPSLLPRIPAPLLLLVLGLLLLAAGIGAETGVTGKDEYWVTFRTPMEMRARGSYWTLWLNDEVRLEKPPLVYWILTGFYSLLGTHPAAARLVGVLSGAGLAALTAALHRRLFARSGLLAGLVVLGCAGVAVEGRRAMLDLPLGFFCLASVYAAVAAWQDRRAWKWAASGLWLAAATLAKGPQSLLFVFSAFASAAILSPRRPRSRELLHAATPFLGVFLLVALPWPLSMAHLHGGYSQEINHQLVDSRFGNVSLRSPLTALSGALLLVFPWTFALLAALPTAFRRDTSADTRRLRWLCLWYFLSVTPFFFLKSFERYMIPILPCVSILVAETLENRLHSRIRRLLLLSAPLLLGLLVGAFSLFAIHFRLAPGWGFLCLLLLAASFTTLRHPRRCALAIALLFAATLGGLYPALGVNALPDHLPWEQLQRHRVGVYSRFSQPAMISMRLGRSVEFTREDRLRRDGFDGYIFTTAEELEDGNRAGTLGRALRDAGLAYEEVLRYRSFYSRRAWIRFTRPGATGEDWAAALRSRDLEPLKPEIVLVRVSSRQESADPDNRP